MNSRPLGRAGAAGVDGPVAGLLLTGGASRRMGFDKSTLEVGGVPNAARLAGLLRLVAAPVFEVGPGRSGLAAVSESPPGGGPLVAVDAGARVLRAQGHTGPVLVLACDLAFVGARVLGLLAGWPGAASVVPVVAGRLQPLCARWSAGELLAAGELVAAGERSMQALLARPGVVVIGEEHWPEGVSARDFADLDSPADLARLAPADRARLGLA